MRTIVFVIAALLTACGPLASSDMPDLENAEQLRAAALRLNPIAPGGQPDPSGMYDQGQPGSDRSLFIEWVRHYAEDDAVRHANLDYKPAPLPRSIAEAIEEQRSADAREAQRMAELQRRTAAEDAAIKAREQAAYQATVAHDQAEAAELQADRAPALARQAQHDRAIDVCQPPYNVAQQAYNNSQTEATSAALAEAGRVMQACYKRMDPQPGSGQ